LIHGFSIRKATSNDTPGILACLSAAFEDYRARYTLAAFLDTVLTPETIERRLQGMFVFVATDESGQIVGTVACNVIDKEEGHIRGLAVLPTWQGSGVAGRLLAHAVSKFGERNCSRITLDTTEPLKRAIRFYGMPLFEYVKILAGQDLRGLVRLEGE
jgi:N-acetylglutamate synthase-like GNAT family acetyltransferase